MTEKEEIKKLKEPDYYKGDKPIYVCDDEPNLGDIISKINEVIDCINEK